MKPLNVVPEVEAALAAGAALAVSISGGKDSQAMLYSVVRWHAERGFPGPIFAVHADLGRIEWSQTPEEVERQAHAAGVRLDVVTRSDGRDLVDHWKARRAKLEGDGEDKPFWSSAAARYCTSDMKRDPIDSHLRGWDFIVSAEGIRAEESSARARKDTCQVRSRIRSTTYKEMSAMEMVQAREEGRRVALTWRPIRDWTEADVWKCLGSSMDDLERRRTLHRLGAEEEALEGWDSHPAYVFGNERLSCSLCVLASKNDLVNGAQHNPDTFQELLEMERDSGWTFRQDLSLAEIAETLATEAAS